MRGSLCVPVLLAWCDPGHLPSLTDSLFVLPQESVLTAMEKNNVLLRDRPIKVINKRTNLPAWQVRDGFDCLMRSRILRALSAGLVHHARHAWAHASVGTVSG